jgi:hypothetical protein
VNGIGNDIYAIKHSTVRVASAVHQNSAIIAANRIARDCDVLHLISSSASA